MKDDIYFKTPLPPAPLSKEQLELRLILLQGKLTYSQSPENDRFLLDQIREVRRDIAHCDRTQS